MIIVFTSLMTTIENQEQPTLNPSIPGFAVLEVDDPGKIIIRELNPPMLDVNPYTADNSIKELENFKISGILLVPPDSIEKIRNITPVTLNLILNPADPKSIVVREEINSSVEKFSSVITQEWTTNLTKSIESQEITINQETTGEPLPFQLMRKLTMVILLFLPLFLFGNMIIDSIVGEKERKTGEILIAMPLSSSQIILGKSLAVIFTIALLVVVWLFIMLLSGFSVNNPLAVYFLVVLTSVPLVALTDIVAVYSKNYKEAGIIISIVYMLVLGLLIAPTLVYLSRPNYISHISPVTLVMRLASGETINIPEILLSLIIIILLSLIFFKISVNMFGRDDIIFGPRPSIWKLILEVIGFKKRFKRNKQS